MIRPILSVCGARWPGTSFSRANTACSRSHTPAFVAASSGRIVLSRGAENGARRPQQSAFYVGFLMRHIVGVAQCVPVSRVQMSPTPSTNVIQNENPHKRQTISLHL